MIYKGIIFDLDGTILDSMPIWSKVGEKFLLSQGIVPPSTLKKILKKKSLRQAAEYFIKTFKIDYTPDEVIGEINHIIEDHYKYSILLKPHIRESLIHLKQNDVKMCIATASNKDLVEKALVRLGVLSYFEFILTCEEIGKGKDQPDIYIQATQRLGLEIEQVLIFEDSLHCIKAAKKAGFNVVGVYDKSNRDQIKKIKSISDYFIYSFQDIKMQNFYIE